MLVLALDTTSEHGGVGIFRDHEALAAVRNPQGTNYSISLFEMAEEALGASGCRLSEVELFAVANGPGSFTGIRVGVAAAQGWAKAFERPVTGVSVLEAMAEAGEASTEWAAALLDARRGEFYLGLFRRSQANAGAFAPQGPGWVMKPQALCAHLEEQIPAAVPLTCLVRQHDSAAARLQPSMPKRFAWQTIPDLLVEPIARLALAAHRQGKVQSPAGLDACYIRRSDAELHWSDPAAAPAATPPAGERQIKKKRGR